MKHEYSQGQELADLSKERLWAQVLQHVTAFTSMMQDTIPSDFGNERVIRTFEDCMLEILRI